MGFILALALALTPTLTLPLLPTRRAELLIVEPTTSVEHASVVDLLAALG